MAAREHSAWPRADALSAAFAEKSKPPRRNSVGPAPVVPPLTSPPSPPPQSAVHAPLSPRDRRALDRAAAVHEDSYRESAAIAERVARRNPDSAEAWSALTLALFSPYQQGRCRAALARWRELAPDDPDILAFEAGLAYSRTEYAEALRWATLALAVNPHDFQLLWLKALCERFLHLPEQWATFALAEKADPEQFARETDRTRAVEQWGSLEVQNAFERILRIGSAAKEGDVDRAKRLLALSEAELALPGPWVEFRDTMVQRISDAELRASGRPAAKRGPLRPPRRSSKSKGGAR